MTLTPEKLRSGIEQAVEKYGSEYTYREHYNECVYLDEGEPRCLLGVALSFIDKDKLAELGEEEAVHQSSVDGSGLPWGNIRSLDMSCTARWAGAAAQDVQDRGGTWGGALEAFDQYVGRHSW